MKGQLLSRDIDSLTAFPSEQISREQRDGRTHEKNALAMFASEQDDASRVCEIRGRKGIGTTNPSLIRFAAQQGIAQLLLFAVILIMMVGIEQARHRDPSLPTRFNPPPIGAIGQGERANTSLPPSGAIPERPGTSKREPEEGLAAPTVSIAPATAYNDSGTIPPREAKRNAAHEPADPAEVPWSQARGPLRSLPTVSFGSTNRNGRSGSSSARATPAVTSVLPVADELSKLPGRAAMVAPPTDGRGVPAERVPHAGDPVADADAVRQALQQYESAYDNLDARAAAIIWPSVDRRALGRAFAAMRSQALTFDSCEIRVSGTSATAQCRGVIQFVPKVGDQTSFSAQHQWLFQMRKSSTYWRIENLTASQPSTRRAVRTSGES